MTHAWTSRSLQALLVLPAAALMAPSPALRAQAPEPAYASQDEEYAGESADRYAQVKVLEGDVRIRKSGEAEEALNRGIPVTEGDVVESRGRGVLQLGDGSRVAFGASTRFQVAALFTGRDGSRQVLLRLDYGRLRVSVAAGDARFRIDTPTGTASLQERSGASVEVDHDRVTRFKLHAGRGAFSNERDRASLGAGERLTIYSAQDSLDRIRSFNTYEMDGFDQWCDDVLVARRSRSYDYVPREIRSYADDLDDYGDWVEVDDVGYCWRPRVAVEWRPYWRGRWGAYAGGMTWVSDDPWGYVTFHHGRWGWSSRWGWYWIPGVFYSPAWVAWNWSGGYCGWAPLSYWNSPCNWGYGAWGGGYCWNVVQVGHINAVSLHNRVVVDRNVFSGFNGGTGTTTWTRGAGRPVAPAWRTSPVIATSAEFRNPAQFTRALDRQVQSQRLSDYGRQLQASGHVLQTRAHVSRPAGPGEGAQGPGTEGRNARPFEDRSLRQPGPRGRDLDRPAPSGDGGARMDRGQDRRPDHRDRPVDGGRETPRPADRGAERSPASRDRLEQPRPIERERGSEAPRERRFEDRRPDPPRERPREERQEWRQERRQERAPSTMDRPVAPPPRSERPSSPPPAHNERPSSPPPSGGDRPSGGPGSRGDGRRG